MTAREGKQTADTKTLKERQLATKDDKGTAKGGKGAPDGPAAAGTGLFRPARGFFRGGRGERESRNRGPKLPNFRDSEPTRDYGERGVPRKDGGSKGGSKRSGGGRSGGGRSGDGRAAAGGAATGEPQRQGAGRNMAAGGRGFAEKCLSLWGERTKTDIL